MKDFITKIEEHMVVAYGDWLKTYDRFYMGRYTGLAEAKKALINELDEEAEEEAEAKIN